MKDKDKTKEQPMDELAQLRQRITELERSEAKLKQTEIAAQSARSYAENITDTVREPLLVLDADLKIISANHSFYNVFTVTPEETIGRLIYDLGNRQWDIPGLRRLLEDILPKKAKFDNYEVDHTFPTLGHKIMLLNARRIRQDETRSLLILLAIEDITERKQRENELKDFEERFRRLFQTTRDGLLLIDKETANIVDANQAIAQMLGYVNKELLGKKLADIGLLKGIKNFKQTIRELLQAGFIYYEDVLVETKQGQRISADVYLVDRAKFIQCNVRDILERKKAIEAEIEKEAANAASKAKSDFLANMSHELRAPLNSILGFSELLQEEMPGSLNATQKEFAQSINTSGKHLLSLINDILDLSKVEAGKMELELGTVSIADVLNASLMMQKEKAMKHGIRLSIEMEPATDIEIEADERKLKQIAFNLLSNAVKFTPDGGSVWVRSRRVPCEDKECIEIAVENTGIGIKQEDLPKLFTEFTQLQASADKKNEGTGLGLAISKKLVELHGGRIWAESEYGKGSKFIFSIPVRPAVKAR